jgi:hypothetical protein
MKFRTLFSVAAISFGLILSSAKVNAQPATETGSVGIQGTVSAPPPALAPIISIPANGASFSTLPVTVGGICDSNLLVKVFKNGVFAGSAQCQSGSFSLSMDLFSGRNELLAKQYDLLDQESPPSSVIAVDFNDSVDSSASERLTLTTNFAKRGADPGQKLSWPIAISGGTGPYAVTVQWGDGEDSAYSIPFPGEFFIDHSYKNPGSYTVVVKAVDVNGRTAYLQIVAIGNGPLSQEGVSAAGGTTGGEDEPTSANTKTTTRILWQPAAIMIPFILSTFWLGKRYAVYRIRKKIEQGERPFSY